MSSEKKEVKKEETKKKSWEGSILDYTSPYRGPPMYDPYPAHSHREALLKHNNITIARAFGLDLKYVEGLPYERRVRMFSKAVEMEDKELRRKSSVLYKIAKFMGF